MQLILMQNFEKVSEKPKNHTVFNLDTKQIFTLIIRHSLLLYLSGLKSRKSCGHTVSPPLAVLPRNGLKARLRRSKWSLSKLHFYHTINLRLKDIVSKMIIRWISPTIKGLTRQGNLCDTVYITEAWKICLTVVTSSQYVWKRKSYFVYLITNFI